MATSFYNRDIFFLLALVSIPFFLNFFAKTERKAGRKEAARKLEKQAEGFVITMTKVLAVVFAVCFLLFIALVMVLG